ncbi:MAG: hypothetical protein AAF317_20580 [Pseudomonadota bacterium]
MIAGWKVESNGSWHNATEIRGALQLADTPTNYLSYATTTKKESGFTNANFKTGWHAKKITSLATFASLNGTAFPQISVKRSKKVTNEEQAAGTLYQQGHALNGDKYRLGSVAEDVTASKNHVINQAKFSRL